MLNFEKVTLKAIKANGGATITRSGFAADWERGYQVSIKDIAIVPMYKLRAKYLEELRKTLSACEYLGIWIEKGKAYIDISTMITRKREAMQLGKRNKQISIFNWQTREAIYL